jgi:hypothetical protein
VKVAVDVERNCNDRKLPVAGLPGSLCLRWTPLFGQKEAAVSEGGVWGGDRALKNLFEEAAHSFDQYRTPTAAVSWPWPHHC